MTSHHIPSDAGKMGIRSAGKLKKLMSFSKATWVIIISSLVFFGFFLWFVKNFDKVPYERELGYSAEARRNQFLAAEQFLKRVNVALESRHDFALFDNAFDEKLGQYDTVLINGSRIGMSSARRDAMREWVNRGGHLVLLATEFYEYEFGASRDKYLDALGLRYYDTRDDYSDYSEEESLTSLNFDGYERETQVHFYPDGYIEDTSGEASFIGGPEYADQFIQYQQGEGLLTVLVDFTVFQNNRIDAHDHAMFLLQLIGNSPQVWLVYNRVQPSLWQLMVSQIPLVIISAASLLLLMMLGQLWRKGAAIKDSPPVQREIMQHIAAAGEFSFRADRGAHLLEEMMRSIHHRLNQLVHGFERLSEDKQLIKLAHITGLPQEQLQILWQTENENQETFITKVQLVQEIRKHL